MRAPIVVHVLGDDDRWRALWVNQRPPAIIIDHRFAWRAATKAAPTNDLR